MKSKLTIPLVVVLLVALIIPVINRQFVSYGDLEQTGGGICVLGMGDCGSTSKSSVENINNQKIITRNELNQLSEQVNKSVANNIVENATSTQSLVSNEQDIGMGNIVASGQGSKVNIKTGQKQQATVDLKSVNITKATNQSAGTIMNEALNWVKNKNSADIVTQMEAAATATAKTGFMTTAPAKGESSVVNKNDITVDTSNIQNISNILKNEVVNNFTTKTVQDAIASVQNKQKLTTGNIVATEGGVIDLAFTQEQVGKALAETLSKMDVTNTILNNTLQKCGVTVDQSNETKSTTTQKGEATAAAENQGFFDALGGLLSGIMGWLMSPFIMIGIVIVVIILIIVYLVLR